MTSRKIISVRKARREDVGYLKTHIALFATPGEMIDPFIVLGHHGPQMFPPNNQGLPFGPHPHRGFETVTFILEGAVMHRDSGGHESVIGAGGVQWMTAGAGVIHSETSPESFLAAGGPLEVLQLWLNLPAKLKMTEPRYNGLQQAEIPHVRLPGGSDVHLVSGQVGEVRGPVESLTNAFMSTLELKGPFEEELPAPSGRAILFYVIRGMVEIDGREINAGEIVTFDTDNDVICACSLEGALVLYGHAEPLNEPMVARGPFVMNTDAEIRQAMDDFRSGKLAGLIASNR